MINFNEQQLESIEGAYNVIKKDIQQTYQISGPAGSGKTTIAKEIARRLGYKEDEVIYIAYVGKATLALALNGLYAKTIHSTIYEYRLAPKEGEDGEVLKRNGKIEYTYKRFKKDNLGKIKLIVLDEGGMVPGDIAKDILSYGIPVVVLGDLNQLPPVFGQSYFLKKPDMILTMVMRQALDNPIIRLSQDILKGNIPYKPEVLGDKCRIITKNMMEDSVLAKHEMIICGRNKTRDDMNRYIRRKIKGIKDDRLHIGDKLICRQNNWKECLNDNIFLVNGLSGTVEYVYPETFTGKSVCIDFKPDFMNEYFERICIDYEYPFMPYEKKSGRPMSFYNLFEFGHVITCHLAQGSQAESVLVYSEPFGTKDFIKRWLYTAVTRSKDELTLVI